MDEKRFVVETVEITDCDTDVSRIAKVITDTKETYSYEDLYAIGVLLNEKEATIEQLQQSQDVKEFSALFNQSIALQREIKDLKEENGKLKQLLNE